MAGSDELVLVEVVEGKTVGLTAVRRCRTSDKLPRRQTLCTHASVRSYNVPIDYTKRYKSSRARRPHRATLISARTRKL